MSEETVREKIKKTGNTPYQFDELEITMDPDIFLPVVALNQLRREALEQLMAAETAKDRREAPAPVSYQTFTEGVREEAAEYESGNAPYLAVSVEQKQALEAALHTDFIRRIYLDGGMLFPPEDGKALQRAVRQIRDAGKEAYYVVNNDTTGMQTVTLNFTKDVSYCKIQSAVKTSGATGNKKLELRDIPAGEAVLVVLE